MVGPIGAVSRFLYKQIICYSPSRVLSPAPVVHRPQFYTLHCTQAQTRYHTAVSESQSVATLFKPHRPRRQAHTDTNLLCAGCCLCEPHVTLWPTEARPRVSFPHRHVLSVAHLFKCVMANQSGKPICAAINISHVYHHHHPTWSPVRGLLIAP